MIETANAQTSVSTSSSSATVSAQAVNFDIPAGKLSSALVAFSTQAHVPLSSQTPTLAGKMFSGLRGQFTPSAALSHILSGSGLSYRVVEGHGFQIVPSPGAANITLGPVRVGGTVVHENPTGPGVGYVATTTMAGTKTDTPIIEIPNSVYVITKKQMEDQQPQNIREALRYTPGIYSEPTGTAGNGYPGSTGNSSSGILQRGFSTLQFIDGLQTNSLSAGETAFLERVETVNGPASVMYGQTSPGGMIGMSLKKPTDKPLHEVSVGFGNWGRYETTVDLSDKITKSGNLKYRIAAIGDTQGTQTDYVNYHRVGVLPSITWDIDKKTSLTFLGSYIYTPGNGTYSSGYPLYGTLINNGRSRLARSTFLGEPNWNIQSDKSAMFEYLFSHTFNKYIKFEQTFRWEKSSLDNKTLSLSGSDDEETVERTPLVQNYQSDTIGMDARFSGKLNTGPISHTWVVGSDFRKYDIQLAYQYDYTQGDNIINTYNPVYGSYTRCFGFTAACKDFGGISSFDRFQEGVYFQDQIKWKGLSILIGGRNDWVNTDNNIHTENNLATNPARITGSEHRYGPQSAFTWRAGIVYHFNFGLAPYFSYSTSFLPQNGFSATGNIFSPLTGKQLEAGIKYEVPHTDVLLTAAAYHIDEDHYLITDPNNTNSSADAGRVTSKGFELSAHANITKNLRFLASYTYTDARYSSTNLTSSLISVSGGVISRGSTVSQKGKYLQTVPRNMASAFLDYTFTLPSLEGFGVNGGVRYIGFTYSDAVNSLKIPDYVLFDIGAHYDFGRRFPILKGLHAQLSISNLTNKYYITSCATSACYIGQGRRVYGNLTYNW
ncbi:TonB-dependent siderophore receptor [Acetobacter syzygii]|uniref:TonB-dependent siderophore receptor n=1 Tax=Acetobacter syzygii TaxID=146476 RepID=UPI0020C69504|nr:TonB-dependent siderophore receptor [Acetobacter syzygii]